jgi:hypothetical protein
MPGDTSRTDPSARQTIIPALCGVEVNVCSQLVSQGFGLIWNFEAGPRRWAADELRKAGSQPS